MFGHAGIRASDEHSKQVSLLCCQGVASWLYGLSPRCLRLFLGWQYLNNQVTQLWNAHSAFPGCITTAISPLSYRQRILLIHTNQIETGAYPIWGQEHSRIQRVCWHCDFPLCLYTDLLMLFSNFVTHSSYTLLCVGVSCCILSLRTWHQQNSVSGFVPGWCFNSLESIDKEENISFLWNLK